MEISQPHIIYDSVPATAAFAAAELTDELGVKYKIHPTYNIRVDELGSVNHQKYIVNGVRCVYINNEYIPVKKLVAECWIEPSEPSDQYLKCSNGLLCDRRVSLEWVTLAEL